MAPIDHRQQHHPLRATPALQRFQRRTNGATRENHVIHQHHLTLLNAVWKCGDLGHPRADAFQIIAMKRGIDGSLGDGVSTQALQLTSQHPRQLHPTGGNPQQHQAAAVIDGFQHLGGQAGESSAQLTVREDRDPISITTLTHGEAGVWVFPEMGCLKADGALG